ncbi:hypothetical protein ACI65C_004917 [Semiaphis heraclei]
MSNRICCVVNCSNTYKNTSNVKFFRFPNRPYERELKNHWIRAINRLDDNGKLWQPINSSLVCGDHFVNNEPSKHPQSPDYIPSIFPKAYKKKTQNNQQREARHCSQLIPINDKNHKCSASTGQAMYKFKKIELKMSYFLTEMESEELNVSLSNLTENTSDDDDNEFYSSLIAEVNERNPLWDHRLPLAARYEPIKQNLWNEIYVALNGIYSIDVLKKKWKYLREKFVREKRKPASGSKNNTFKESILKELRESRPVVPTRAPPTNEENGDLHFCKYLAHLMKNMTEKKN